MAVTSVRSKKINDKDWVGNDNCACEEDRVGDSQVGKDNWVGKDRESTDDRVENNHEDNNDD